MTSKLVVNTIEADTGISSVSFASSISMSSTSKFFFGAAGIDIGADTNINRPASGVLGFNINSSEKVRITSDGKIGINTISPTYGMHLHGTTASSNAYYYAEQSTAGASAGFRLKTTGSHFSIYGATSGSALGIYDYNASAERVTITSGGNILIGTSVDSNNKITMYGTNTSIVMQNAATGTGSGNGFYLGNGNGSLAYVWNYENDEIRFATNNTERLRLFADGTLRFYNSIYGADNRPIYLGASNDLSLFHDSSGASIIRYNHNVGGLHFRNNNNDNMMIIDASGNVMINRSSASKKFSIKESSTSSGVYINQTVGGSSHLTGYAVGIGFDPEGYPARNKIAIVAEGTNQGYSKGKLHFLLDDAPDSGEATLSESRMSIDSLGRIVIGDAVTSGSMDMGFGIQQFSSKSATYSAQILGATAAALTTSIIYNSNTSFGSSVSLCDWRTAAANSTAFYFLRCSTSSASDNEFFLAGDGAGYADGNWNSGGADYAEYFEWSDGNASDEDRRGMTVVLDGTKIKIATSSDSADNIIGVVSGNPAMVADTAYCKWSGKYQRDDYNAYVRDSEGHRVLNPDYDDTKTYSPRKERKEWDAIGMVGKLRVRKGQQTGTRWIKMKDISDSVEEWLVR